MESLPKQFVIAMRTLFDIMDDKHTGYVRLTDIENRWRDDRIKGLPRGVIESLQKVASHDGLLTFERFCSGLKICLLKNQVVNTSNNSDTINPAVRHSNKHAQTHRPPSAPMLDIVDIRDRDRNWNDLKIPEKSSQLRTISMPQLVPRKDVQIPEINSTSLVPSTKNDLINRVLGPPKPPRLEKQLTERKEPELCPLKPEEPLYDSRNVSKEERNEVRSVDKQGRGHGDGRPDTELVLCQRRAPRRREPRRHTLHNGVDYNLLKRMKQIELEKDVLLQGLSAVEEAREWYMKQLADVQEKIRYASRMGTYVEPWSEAQQERLELLRARITELNRQLGALASGWRQGPLSLHMNLALPAPPLNDVTTAVPNRATVLRTQNRMLIEEVNRKNERISVLECEKSALIRELLLQRNRNKISDNFS